MQLIEHIEENSTALFFEDLEAIAKFAGGKIGALASNLSKEKIVWSRLVDQEDKYRKSLKRDPKNVNLRKRLSFTLQDKIAAREKYLQARDRYSKETAKASAAAVSKAKSAVSSAIKGATPLASKLHRKIIATN